MRIVSQHENVDLPYENTALLHNMEHVVAQFDGKEYVMGKYSSEEKAYKVMKLLHQTYAGKLICQNIELTDEAKEMLSKWNTQVLYGSVDYQNPHIEYINETIVFQFPKDEEVE